MKLIPRVCTAVSVPTGVRLRLASSFWKNAILPSSASNGTCQYTSSADSSDSFGTLKVPLETDNRRQKKNPERVDKIREKARSNASADSKSSEINTKWSHKNSEQNSDTLEAKIGYGNNWKAKSLKHVVEQTDKNYRSFSQTRESAQDTFGDISKDDPHFKIETEAERKYPEDSDCVKSQTFKPLDIKRKRFVDYARDIRKLSNEGRTKEAIELFESLAALGVTYQKKPFLYSVIISACGRKGYTRKAFQIYAKMRQQQLRPTPAVLTGLFNSCAECPFPKLGLQKAIGLHRQMQEEGWQPSQLTYHAMIKAYGRCGDLASAFLLVDEMKTNHFAITDETFAFLLQACIADKEAGFTHAITVLRKMRTMRIKPSLYNYNLLLRTVRDCGVGPVEIASKLLLDWKGKPQLSTTTSRTKMLPLTKPSSTLLAPQGNSCHTRISTAQQSNELVPEVLDNVPSKMQLQEVVFDLLSPRPPGTDILALGTIKTSADRLALIGGTDRVIERLLNLKYKPDIKTMSLLLECQEATCSAEENLLKQMKEISIKPDVDFFNVLIKKRCSRWDYKRAREVLDLISEHGLYPDVATFGTLAMTCKNRSVSKKLLKDMVSAGFTPNIKILGALMKNAFIAMDFAWMLNLMSEVVNHNVSPCEVFLQQLEDAWKDATHALVLLEKGKTTVPAWAETERFQEDFKHFCLTYKKWLKSVRVDIPEHPWQQFMPEVKNDEKVVQQSD